MKARFEIPNLSDTVTHVGSVEIPQGYPVSDLPVIFPFFFKIGKNDATSLPELQTTKLDEPMTVTVSDGTTSTDYQAIRIFGGRKRVRNK